MDQVPREPQWLFSDYAEQYRIAFDASVDQVEDQRARLEALRGRAATVLSVATVVAAFLGDQVFDPGALERLDTGWWVFRTELALGLALLAFVSIAAAALWIWLPMSGHFGLRGGEIIRSYVESGKGAYGPAELLRELAWWNSNNYDDNEGRLGRRQIALAVSCGALALQLILLLLVLWDLRP